MNNSNKTTTNKTVSENLFATKSYILSLDTIIRSDSDETIGTVLQLVPSSHIPVFIFSKSNDFLGLLSVYETRYKQSSSYTTKTGSVAKTPPHLTEHSPLYEVASRMLETHVYSLPIFTDDKKLSGIIDGKKMLNHIQQDADMLDILLSSLQLNDPITLPADATVKDGKTLMNEKHISRVLLVDDEGKLTGIVSRQDLLDSSMKPTDKERFGKNGNPQTDRAFDVEKKYRDDAPIATFATDRVNTVDQEAGMATIISQLLSSNHGSIVVVNSVQKPVGFLSVRDLLNVVASLDSADTIPLIMSNPSDNVSSEELSKAEELIGHFGKKLNKRVAIEKIEIHFEEPKYASGGTAVFNTSVVVSPIAGSPFIANTSRANFLESIQAATDQIEKQEIRSDTTRKESAHGHV